MTAPEEPELTGNVLPPFPVDDATLDMLDAAMDPRSHGDPEAVKSSVWPFLKFMSQLGGSDTDAIQEVIDEGDPSIGGLAGAPTYLMRDQQYTEHCVMRSLIDEVRRLRGELAAYTSGSVVGVP